MGEAALAVCAPSVPPIPGEPPPVVGYCPKDGAQDEANTAEITEVIADGDP